MSLGRSLGRVLGLLVAVEGVSVAYYGFLVGSATVPRGLDALLAGEVNVFVVVGLLGVAVALSGLAVAAGRGRSWAVSVGGGLVVLAVLGLVVLAFSPLLVALCGGVGLLLFFAGASLNGHHPNAA